MMFETADIGTYTPTTPKLHRLADTFEITCRFMDCSSSKETEEGTLNATETAVCNSFEYLLALQTLIFRPFSHPSKGYSCHQVHFRIDGPVLHKAFHVTPEEKFRGDKSGDLCG